MAKTVKIIPLQLILAACCVQITGLAGKGKTKLMRGLIYSAAEALMTRQRLSPFTLAGTKLAGNGYFKALERSLLRVYCGSSMYRVIGSDIGSFSEWGDVYRKVAEIISSPAHAANFNSCLAHHASETYIAFGARFERERRIAGSVTRYLAGMQEQGLLSSDDLRGSAALQQGSSVGSLEGVFGVVASVIRNGKHTMGLLASCLESSIFCDALLDLDSDLEVTLAKLGQRLQNECGGVVSVRTEKVWVGIGGSFTFVNGRAGSYEGVLPLRAVTRKQAAMPYLKFEVTCHPLDLILASMYFAAVHVGTLSSKYEAEIQGVTTLAGGMSSAIMDVSQEISDHATQTGSIVVIEVRDQFTRPSGKGDFDRLTGTEGLPEHVARFMATNEIAVYISAFGKGDIRRRAYYAEGSEYIAKATWDLDDLENAMNHSHGLPEVDNFQATMEALKIDYRVLDLEDSGV